MGSIGEMVYSVVRVPYSRSLETASFMVGVRSHPVMYQLDIHY